MRERGFFLCSSSGMKNYASGGNPITVWFTQKNLYLNFNMQEVNYNKQNNNNKVKNEKDKTAEMRSGGGGVHNRRT